MISIATKKAKIFPSYDIRCGNALSVINNLTEEGKIVNTVVTSPPYFNKRKYGDSQIEIGRETSVSIYIDSMVGIFNAIPLHPQGSVWVNIGDKRDKNGSLLGIPERFIIRMIDNGWLLADSVIWAKSVVKSDGSTVGGSMPEPAAARLNGNSFENFYRFVKTKKISDAWTDTCAIRIPRVQGVVKQERYLPPELMTTNTDITGRNLSNVWQLAMGQTKEAHYAVYPTELIERPVAMTCPHSICKFCGHLRTRIVEMVEYDEGRGTSRIFHKYNQKPTDLTEEEDWKASNRQDTGRSYTPRKPETKGWSDCGHDLYETGVVLDPFIGSGTTAEVALKLGRSVIGIDLYPKFKQMTETRCATVLQHLSENLFTVKELIK